MEQPIILDETLQKDYARIESRLLNTNYPDEFAPRILEMLAAGQREFTVRGTTPVEQGADRMQINLIIGPANKDKTMTVLQAMEVELTVSPHIPNLILKDSTGKEVLRTLDLDEKITKASTSGLFHPGKDNERAAKAFASEISKDMQLLMKEMPAVFNLLTVKHNPPLNFDIPADLQQQQAKIISDNHIQNTFSSFYNLTPTEMYGMLKNGLPVYKQIFEDGQQTRKWLRPTDEKDASGRMKIWAIRTGDDTSIYTALDKYNFLELRNPMGLQAVARTLEKANLAMVTNTNDKGEKYVLIGAKPGYYMDLVMYTLDRQSIRNHNDYLKNPLTKTKGEVFALPTSSQQKKYGEGFAEAARKATMTPKEHIVGGTPPQETTNKKNSKNSRKLDSDDKGKKKLSR